MLIRVVDIGSNSIKAALYDVENQTHKAVGKDKLQYSIGEDVFSQGYIGEDGQEKVARFIEGLPASHGGEKIHFSFVMATSAVRSARNRDVFARKLQQRTGLPCRILTGEEESFLIHMGIANKAGIGPNEVIKTIDIGGGSAEISWSRGLHYLFGHSYDLGAIRLSKRFLRAKALTREAFDQIEELALSEFKKTSETGAGPEAAPPKGPVRAFGSSGNIRAIGKSLAGVRNAAFAKLIPEITVGSLDDLVELSVGREPKQLSDIFNGLPPERARIIMPAVVVLKTSMRCFGIDRLEVSEAGLREGVAFFWSRNGHLNLPVAPAGTAAVGGRP